jgi:hypothetical protein
MKKIASKKPNFAQFGVSDDKSTIFRRERRCDRGFPEGAAAALDEKKVKKVNVFAQKRLTASSGLS